MKNNVNRTKCLAEMFYYEHNLKCHVFFWLTVKIKIFL